MIFIGLSDHMDYILGDILCQRHVTQSKLVLSPARLGTKILCESFVFFVSFVVVFCKLLSYRELKSNHKAHKEHEELTKNVRSLRSPDG